MHFYLTLTPTGCFYSVLLIHLDFHNAIFQVRCHSMIGQPVRNATGEESKSEI